MSTSQNQTAQTAVRQVVEEAFNKGNYAVLRQYVNPDFVEHQFGSHPTIEGMQKDIEALRKSFPDLHVNIEDMDVTGDKVWVRTTASGTNRGGFMGPPNGKPFKITVFELARFEDGKLVEHWGSPDRFHLMVQMGLLPQPQPA